MKKQTKDEQIARLKEALKLKNSENKALKQAVKYHKQTKSELKAENKQLKSDLNAEEKKLRFAGSSPTSSGRRI